MKLQHLFVLGLGFGLFLPALPVAAKSVITNSNGGITAQVDDASGHYEITASINPGSKFAFAGELGQPVQNLVVTNGSDPLGAYREIRFTWRTNVLLSGSIRVHERGTTAIFTLGCEEAAHELPVMFPRFTSISNLPYHFSFRNDVFAPPTFTLEQNGTPWLLFDGHDNGVIISPADNFLLATMRGDGTNEVASGLNASARDLPAHFQHATLLNFGHSLNRTWAGWGAVMQKLVGRTRVANDSDIGLRYLGYWTDAGAFYYYNYDPALGYQGTMEALVRHYREQNIPIRYLQLDSWWYYKTLTSPAGRTEGPKNAKLPEGEWNRYGGLIKYEAHPALFPDGLKAFQDKIKLPLITHNRWIDPASPYREQFKVSGFAGVDPLYWQKIMNYIADSGVVCYEQDWLNVIYEHSPELSSKVGMGDAFTDGMAQAAKARGMSMQYCMALPRFFLEGSRYDNLTTIRTSNDRFERKKWDSFIFTSHLASSLGIWPWADVFMSTETDNLLISVLSGGMVGVGDAIGKESKENLLRVARPDGVLVKPDVSLVPLDHVYMNQANGRKSPMIAATHTDHGSLRTAYLFAYNRQDTDGEIGFTGEGVGVSGPQRQICALNARTGDAQFQPFLKQTMIHLKPEETAYYILAPVGQSGLAFFGDEGKFVSNGRQRIAALQDAPGQLTVTVTFAAGEKSVRLFGYGTNAPTVTAQSGSVGTLAYDAGTKRFSVDVSPAAAIIPGQDPTQAAIVQFSSK